MANLDNQDITYELHKSLMNVKQIPDTAFFDNKGFNEDGLEYTIQDNKVNEDPAIIILEMLRRNKVDAKFIAFLRYSDIIAQIGNIELKKGEKITLEQGGPDSYELNVGKKIYTINTVQNKVNEIK